MEISHSTRSGQNKSNEDRYRIREEKAGTVIVLADGMGGRSNGATAAAIVSDIICDHNWNFSNIQVSCNNAFAQADKAIAKKSEELRTKMGCAVGCLVIVKNTIFYSGLGDIRLYAQTKTGKQLLMSKDDVLTGKNGQTYLTRSIRGRGLRYPISVITLSTKDILTCSLCTDGYYNNDQNDDATIIEIQFK